jgi:pimeloyl-ACP methyl ester carboxylesterase
MVPGRFSCLAAVGPVGVKFGGRTERAFAEVLVADPEKISGLLYHDAGRDPWRGRTEREDLVRRAQQREAFAHFVWEPYLHNPKLRHLLGRLVLPVLVVAGEQDGLVAGDYYPALAAALPDAGLQRIAAAGHFPQIEQPGAAAECVRQFIAKYVSSPAGSRAPGALAAEG